MAPFGHRKFTNEKPRKHIANPVTELSNSATELDIIRTLISSILSHFHNNIHTYTPQTCANNYIIHKEVYANNYKVI